MDTGIGGNFFREVGQTYFGFPGAGISQAETGELLVVRIVTILLLFAAAIAVIFLVIGGFRYVAASGNEEAVEKAKKTITGSVIGLVIIVMAYAGVSIIGTILTRGPGEQTTTSPFGGAGGGDVEITTSNAEPFNWTVGVPNSITFEADNCSPCDWTFAGRPSFAQASGNTVSGNPTSASAGNTFSFTAQARTQTNPVKQSFTKTFQIQVSGPEAGIPGPGIVTPPFDLVSRTAGFSLTCAVSTSCTFAVASLNSGTKPYIVRSTSAGITGSRVSIHPTTGEVSVQLSSSTAGSRQFSITFNDSSSPPQAKTTTFTVNFTQSQ